MLLKLWTVVACFALSSTACLAQNATELLRSFVVQSETPRSSEAVRFRCRAVEAGSFRCEMSVLSINYREWSKTLSGEREPKQCHVTSANLMPQYFHPIDPGRWQRQDSAICGAVIATELVAEDGQVTMLAKTLINPDYRPDNKVCSDNGPAGTVKVYKPVTKPSAVPLACIAVVIDLY